MITLSDSDCNQVRQSISGNPNVTFRCTLPEGHDDRCGKGAALEMKIHRHRAPIDTDTTVSDYVGVHAVRGPAAQALVDLVNGRPGAGVAHGPHAVDARLLAGGVR